MEELDALAGVEKTSVFGTAVHAVLASSSVDIGALRIALDRAGLDVRATEVVQPSLEDVFLDLVERTGRT
jgi:hypothetical protein